MIFYRQISNETLYGFGGAIGEVPILGKKLIDHQNDIITSVGGTIENMDSSSIVSDATDYFLFDENIFFTTPFLKACIEKVEHAKKNIRFCLKKNSFNDRFVLPHPDDTKELHQLGFYYKINEQPFEICIIDQVIFEHYNEMPDQIVKGRKYHMDQCDTFAIPIISPFHLLFANLAMNLVRTIQFQNKIPAFLKQKFGQSGGKWFFRGLKRMNKIGKNCKIHPTALIEGSILGDNVTVGANSIVRLSTLESDCYVSDNVSVINSILSKKTFIANSNYINSCFTYNEVFLIHGPYQLSIFGENSACFAVINCDIRLDQGNIKIPTSFGVLDSNQPLLGIAYGHRSKTGGGNIVAAGRIVPNDLHITPPDSIILGFDKK